MSTNSHIEWTEATWNFLSGCNPVSPGCANCYAMKMSARLEAMGQQHYAGTTIVQNGHRIWSGFLHFDEKALLRPLCWKRPRRIFVNSMSDLFHERVTNEEIDKAFAVMALCPQHTFQILTKRPGRMAEYSTTRKFSGGMTFLDVAPFGEMTNAQCDEIRRGVRWPLSNVWLGTSIENRASLSRAMEVSKCPAAIHFWSLEPLLEDLGNIRGYLEQNVEWVIVGGESGPGARPFDVAWARSIVKQCKEKGVSCFVKQLGARIIVKNDSSMEWPRHGDEWIDLNPDYMPSYQGEEIEIRLENSKGGDISEWPADLRIREFPSSLIEKSPVCNASAIVEDAAKEGETR